MRAINKITIVTNSGVKEYAIGDVVNEIEIKKIIDVSAELESRIEIGFAYLSNSDPRLSRSGITVVEVWNAPVVVEYMEVVE